MRFALAVAASAIAQAIVFLRVGDWVGSSATLALVYLMIAAAGAGYFAGRRPALAGFLSLIAGALAYAAAASAMRPVATDVFTLIDWGTRLVIAVLPYAVGGAIAGWLGGELRRRVVPIT